MENSLDTTVRSPQRPVQPEKPQPSSKKHRGQRSGGRRLLITLGIVAVSLLILAGVWLAISLVRANNELHKYKNPETSQKQSEQVTTEVAKIAILPQGEQPVIATVSDVSKLQDKPFFKNAQDGDKVLIYKQAKKAILYRPSTKQIVEEAAYDASTSAQQTK